MRAPKTRRALRGGSAVSAPLPKAHELASVCEALVAAWHRRVPALEWPLVAAAFGPATSDWAGLVATLSLVNCFQWHLEDECRASYADSARLAALKREIDESNRRRVACIDAIDELV